jgi:hypothetical protein
LQSPFQRIGRRPTGGSRRGRVRLTGFAFSLAISCGLPTLPAFAAPFDCHGNRCGILLDAPLKEFVVGTIDGVATPAQSAALLARAQAAGFWRLFPPRAPEFSEKIQPISVSFAPGHSITVLAGADETRMLRLRTGEIIRFAPHRGLHEKPRPNDPYWVGIGCVAPLCAPGDTLCASGFHPGLYRLSDGAELDDSGLHALPGGIRIDTMSMRPKPE